MRLSARIFMMSEEKRQPGFWKRLTGHIRTVHHHRSLVRKHCFACGLYWQGLAHDLSKYSPSEFIPSVKYYQGWRSPYVYEKELHGYSQGWLHHKGHNKHHWEYWYDTLHGVWSPVPMPYNYLIESICDRVAACETYHGKDYKSSDPLDYFMNHDGGKYMHPETAKEMQHILEIVRDNGQDEAFRLIRQSLKDGKPL